MSGRGLVVSSAGSGHSVILHSSSATQLPEASSGTVLLSTEPLRVLGQRPIGPVCLLPTEMITPVESTASPLGLRTSLFAQRQMAPCRTMEGRGPSRCTGPDPGTSKAAKPPRVHGSPAAGNHSPSPASSHQPMSPVRWSLSTCSLPKGQPSRAGQTGPQNLLC